MLGIGNLVIRGKSKSKNVLSLSTHETRYLGERKTGDPQRKTSCSKDEL